MKKTATLSLTEKLIRQASITPNDQDCQKILIEELAPLGFNITPLRFGDVDNLWARFGETSPLFVFAGHTDVVPPGDLHQWHSPPFEPTIRDNVLYGRGAADMKSSVAAMVIAAKEFVTAHPHFKGSIAFLITSDEEGQAKNGTAKVVDYLQQQKIKLDYCLVGEASSEKKLGDTIKIGRRGSLHGKLIIRGKQGHIAYPQLADNPIHKSLQALHALSHYEWDKGNDAFPPTSFQIHTIHAGIADNVIPGELEVQFNFRYAPVSTASALQHQVEKILTQHSLNYDITWRESARPFLTAPGKLIHAVSQAIHDITNHHPISSTTGGTSDGRFIATTGCEIVEFGPINQSIHQINEHINVDELELLKQTYLRILEILLLKQPKEA